MKRTLSPSRRDFLRGLLTLATSVVAEPVINVLSPPPLCEDYVPSEPFKLPVIESEPHWHPDAFSLLQEKVVFLDPGPVKNPLSVRYIKEYDIKSDRFPVRLDVLYGMAVINPKAVARISSVE